MPLESRALDADSDSDQRKSQLYDDLLEALYATFGVNPGYRVAHAKGMLVTGTFIPSAQAKQLSRAIHFQRPTPVVVRFSNFSGLPTTPDPDPLASPHGFAVRFDVGHGEYTDIVGHSFNGFPVGTPEEFLGFLQGIAASSAVPPNTAPLEKFLQGHPRAKAFLEADRSASASYASLSYFGVNAFRFINNQGVVTVGRYRIEPVGVTTLNNLNKQSASGNNYLRDELASRLHVHPVEFRLMLQLPSSVDKIDDGSIAWSDSNEKVCLGILRLDRAVEAHRGDSLQRAMGFSPGRLIDGIEPSADPMIAARDEIYRRALLRRR